MQYGTRWAYGAARAVGDVERGLGVLRITGVVTPSTSLEILRDNTDWLGRERVVCQVADYSGAGIALDPETLLGNVHAALERGQGLRTPTALVVPPDTLSLWSAYAWLMARAGITRAVFTDRDLARAWASTQSMALTEIREEQERRGLPAR